MECQILHPKLNLLARSETVSLRKLGLWKESVPMHGSGLEPDDVS